MKGSLKQAIEEVKGKDKGNLSRAVDIYNCEKLALWHLRRGFEKCSHKFLAKTQIKHRLTEEVPVGYKFHEYWETRLPRRSSDDKTPVFRVEYKVQRIQ